MRSKRWIAALAASAGVLWASAHAADEPPVQAPPGIPPGIIIFELQPAPPGTAPEGEPPQAAEPGAAQAQEQAMLSMLLLQLLAGMEGQAGGGSGAVEVQQRPPDAQRI